MAKSFRLELSIDAVLTAEQVWPDGNAPEDPTPDDVRREFLRDGVTLLDAAIAWNLCDDAELVVTLEPT